MKDLMTVTNIAQLDEAITEHSERIIFKIGATSAGPMVKAVRSLDAAGYILLLTPGQLVAISKQPPEDDE